MDINAPIRKLDGFQRSHPWVGFPYAVVKRFGDSGAGSLAAGLAYYGFFSLFPPADGLHVGGRDRPSRSTRPPGPAPGLGAGPVPGDRHPDPQQRGPDRRLRPDAGHRDRPGAVGGTRRRACCAGRDGHRLGCPPEASPWNPGVDRDGARHAGRAGRLRPRRRGARRAGDRRERHRGNRPGPGGLGGPRTRCSSPWPTGC